MFKKRQQKGGLRKSREVDSNEAEDEDELEQIRLINELREDQKDRQRTTGINSNKLMSASGMFILTHFPFLSKQYNMSPLFLNSGSC